MIRRTIRELTRAKTYTAAAVLTMSVVIAANASVLGAAYAVLWPTGAIHRADELFVAWSSSPQRDQPLIEVTHQQFSTWARSPTTTRLAAFGSSHWPAILDEGPEPIRLAATAVSGSFFETLGTHALVGRTFTEADDEGAGLVAILSHAAWVSRFSMRPDIIGHSVRLDGKPFTVVGVMPPDFDFPRGADLWMPVEPLLRDISAQIGANALDLVGVLYVVGRRATGSSLDAVARDFDRLTIGDADAGRRTAVTPLAAHLLGPARAGLWWLLGAAGVLVLVACANLSGLALTRVLAHRRENAIRIALGGTGRTLAFRWILECVVITVIGCAIGLPLSRWLMAGMVALAPEDIPRLSNTELNLPVAALTLLLAATAMVLWSAAPAAAGRSPEIVAALRTARTTTNPRTLRVRTSLVIAQICMSVALLIGGGLIVRSFVNLLRVDLGFNPNQVLTMTVNPRGAGSEGPDWFEQLAERLDSLSGVEAAGAVFLRPLAYGAIGSDETVALRGGQDSFEASLLHPRVNHQTATTGYFRTMRIPLLRGRTFDSNDAAATLPVVVIGESTARTLFRGEDPLGRQIAFPSLRVDDDPLVWRTVIGVVKDVHYRGLGDVRLDVYEPASQSRRRPGYIVVRTAGAPLAAAGLVRAAIREADPRAIVNGMTSLEAVTARALAPWRLTSWMLAFIAVISFLLSLMGLVGQLALELAGRRAEFAIRLAVGARPADIRTQIMRRTVRRTAIGLLLGAVGAFAGSRLLSGLLFGVTNTDPVTWVTVLLGTAAVAIGVAYVLASRASRLSSASVLGTDA